MYDPDIPMISLASVLTSDDVVCDHVNSLPYAFFANNNPTVPHGCGVIVAFGEAVAAGLALATGVGGTQLSRRETFTSWQPETSHVSVPCVEITDVLLPEPIPKYSVSVNAELLGFSSKTHRKLYRKPARIVTGGRYKSLASFESTI
jgi:hypothetical protein